MYHEGKRVEGKDGTGKVEDELWYFYGPFPACDVPLGLAHKGEEGIRLDALMKGLASGATVNAANGGGEAA